MAWTPKQLKAVHQIEGILKDKAIKPGTFFKAKTEKTEKSLLASGAAVAETVPEGPEVVEDEKPKRKTAAKKTAAKTTAAKTTEKPAETETTEETDTDLV